MFLYPMILSTARWRHGSHFRHGRVNSEESDVGDKQHIDRSGCASIEQRDHRCAQADFPRCHQNHAEAEHWEEAEDALSP